jgi:FtsP/CotA-like multicopper oxidase with cupredoxin domain
MHRSSLVLTCAAIIALASSHPAFSQAAPHTGCPVVTAGSAAEPPEEIRSHNGVLKVSLSFQSSVDAKGQMHYCYIASGREQSPTLQLYPGDLLILDLKNQLSPQASREHSHPPFSSNDCGGGMMSSDATNLHFHGLAIPPICHQDDSLHTLISPSSKSFEYRFRISKNQPPGLYWYHPHPHGHSEEQVLGGASGALIVEGIEQSNKLLQGLPQRIFVIRDQKRQVSGMVDREPGAPAKDLSINFVPVPYPDYPTAVITTKPLRHELWRVLNASADTYLDLFVLFAGKLQKLGLVAIDGVPISQGSNSKEAVVWKDDIPIPPGGRAEFISVTPSEGVKAQLLTAGVETAPPNDEDSPGSTATQPTAAAIPDDDDYTPPRPLAQIVASSNAIEPPPLRRHSVAANTQQLPPLTTVHRVRERKLYFSEKVMDPKHPATSTVFYLTEEGQIPAPFDPAATVPNITVHQGDVEDWTIENRSIESHDFHIHQTHFLVLERDGEPADGYLRDTVDVPFWDGTSTQYPSVKLRMDFRDPNIVGTFPYHCHILQHADGGMMGLIRVEPSPAKLKRVTAR